MERDVVGGGAVELGLGARDAVEDVERAARRALGQRGADDAPADVGVVIVRVSRRGRAVRVVVVAVRVVVVAVRVVVVAVRVIVHRRANAMRVRLDPASSPSVPTLTSIAAIPPFTTRCARNRSRPAPIASSASPIDVHRHAQVDQRAEHHVARGAARAVDVQVQPARLRSRVTPPPPAARS